MSAETWPLLARLLSDTLVALAWQFALLGGLVAGLLRLLRRQPASSRYALLGSALLCCALLGGWQLSKAWPAAAETDAGAAWQIVADDDGGSRTVRPSSAPAALSGAPSMPDDAGWRETLAAAWLLGAMVMSLRLLGGLVWLSRWRRQALVAPRAMQHRLDRIAQALGLRRGVMLRLLSEGSGPVTVGWWRPVVLMPAALLSGLPLPLLDALLAHELAHVRRWDYLANLLQRLVEALFFFHPVVWWLSSRLRAERELVADQLAAEVLASPRDLALALQALAEHDRVQPAALPSLVAAAQGGELLARVQALLRRPASPGSSRASMPVALMLALVLLTGPVLLALGLPAGADRAAGEPGSQAVPAATELRQGPPVAAPSTRLSDLRLASSQVLVSDADTGEVLWSRDAARPVPVASLSKLMTALLVVRSGQDLQQELTVSREELRGGTNGMPSLKPGQRLTREAALTLMLQASDNRAALLLARHYPGGWAAFADASDALARRLGLAQTQLHHPSGADDGNRASAEDVARLLAAAAQEPLILRGIASARLQVRVDGRERESRSTHPLMGDADWPILMAKTGTSRAAGRCVALQMQAGGRRLSVVLLGAPDAAAREADLLSIRTALQA